MSAGGSHTACVTSRGRLGAFGHRAEGKCHAPELEEGEVYVSASAGGYHTACVTSRGRLVAFGHRGSGRCDAPALPDDERYERVEWTERRQRVWVLACLVSRRGAPALRRVAEAMQGALEHVLWRFLVH